jgi:hypothetical protein
MSKGQYQLSGYTEGVLWAALLILRIVAIHIPVSNTSWPFCRGFPLKEKNLKKHKRDSEY